MKNHTLSKFWFSSIIALILLVSCNDKKGTTTVVKDKNTTDITAPEVCDSSNMNASSVRESITFILGEDKDLNNPYYTEATKYYSAAEKTTFLDIKCRSLQEVRNYLVKHAPSNKLPWGKINLISHGDQWLGLSVKVTLDSKRSTEERLLEYIQKGTFVPLSDSIVDNQTCIVIHACGVGNNPELINAFALVFKTNSFTPEIRAPRLFEFYSTESNKTGKPENLHYMTKAWMVSYKKDEKPGNILLCNMFEEKYPSSGINWHEALNRKQPRFAGDIYHYTFTIPVSFVISIDNYDTIPDLSNHSKILQWINQQSKIIVKLNQVQIPAENFSWYLKKGFGPGKAGRRSPALMVKGYCSVMCVLKPLVDETKIISGIAQPLIPNESDTTYYYTLKGVSYRDKFLAQN